MSLECAFVSGADSAYQLLRSSCVPLPPEHAIGQMSPGQIRGVYFYIARRSRGGGIISLIRSLPMLWHGCGRLRISEVGSRSYWRGVARTDQDLSMKFLALESSC